jgi:Ca-activated chloride channel family protein
MRFSHPFLLLLLLLLPALWYCQARAERYLAVLLDAFTVSGGKPALWRRKARLLLPILAFFLMTVALAGPAVEITVPEEATYQAALVIGLDVSKSMLAEDVLLSKAEEGTPEISNRLNLARRFLYGFLGGLKNENAGMFFFAGNGLETVPLTRDHGFFRYILKYADLLEMTDSGSNLGEALVTAKLMLEEAGHTGIRTLILISDGEVTLSDDAAIRRTLAEFSDQGVRVFCVGVGADRAVYIPARKPGTVEFDDFYRDKEGEYLQTRLEEDLLKSIAAATGGAYFRLEEDQLTRISQDLRKEIYRSPVTAQQSAVVHKQWLELMPSTLVLALLSYSMFLVI